MISNHNKIPLTKSPYAHDPTSNRPPTTIYILFKKSSPCYLNGQCFTSKCVGRIKCSKFTANLKCAKIVNSLFGSLEDYLAWYTDLEWSESEKWLSMYPDGYIDIKNENFKEGKE